jgi:hypothetical protein
MRELAALFDIDKRNTTPYHPECDGQTERFNRTLGAMLRAVTSEFPTKWGEYLAPLTFAYNTATHATTGVQPFVMLYGRFPRLPADLIYSTMPIARELLASEYAEQLCRKMRHMYDIVSTHRQFKVEKQKFYHDRRIKCKEYNLDDRVLCRVEAPPGKGLSKKLAEKYDGRILAEKNACILAM